MATPSTPRPHPDLGSEVLGRVDFLYVADSKLCSGDAMRHIDPAAHPQRGQVFREWAQSNQPQWTEAVRLPGERIGDYDLVWSTFPSPLPSAEGYRIVWVHSTARLPATRAPADRPRVSRSAPNYATANHPPPSGFLPPSPT